MHLFVVKNVWVGQVFFVRDGEVINATLPVPEQPNPPRTFFGNQELKPRRVVTSIIPQRRVFSIALLTEIVRDEAALIEE
jgi:hypothetical protein